MDVLLFLLEMPLADYGPEISDGQRYGESDYDDGGATLTLIVLCVVVVGVCRSIWGSVIAARERRWEKRRQARIKDGARKLAEIRKSIGKD